MITKFFKLTSELINGLTRLRLNGNDYKLWLYLITLDPFGDRPVTIPTSSEICKLLKMSLPTYFRSKAKLQKLGLINFSDKETQIQNLLGEKSGTLKNDAYYIKTEIPQIKNEIDHIKNDNKTYSKALSTNDSGLSQTISNLSDQSDQLKYDKNINERREEGLIDDRCLLNVVEMNENEIDDRIEIKLTDNQLIKEEVKKQDTTPCSEDERLKNEEFIRYAQGKLPKARDIKRYPILLG